MTKTKTILAAAALMLAPGLAAAYECNWSKGEQVTMSCAPGTSWNAASGTCTPEATG
ncbi:adenylosuccinate lyase [Jannaschia sp. M317]|uniref:adenylosuccinate lyase n=1 Tax=Jannaschia sp. M317 TaxID=2867011 RepID=UPI0021A90999|nr:adenylosuccinate lyase [Jannaschia sp. M317]UWQ17166.1 adenylosuccinate lyase [Jannaschia sp. M317]